MVFVVVVVVVVVAGTLSCCEVLGSFEGAVVLALLTLDSVPAELDLLRNSAVDF